MPIVRVVTVDDQDVFRRAASALIGATPGFQSVGEACSGPSALDTVARTGPDLVLLDIRMHGMNGIETARRLRARHPKVVVVLVSAEDPVDHAQAAKDCGAAALIAKEDLAPRRLAALWRSVGSAHGSP